MPFFRSLHRGIAYGAGHMQTAGTEGQVIAPTGNDLFAPITGNATPFGILRADCAAGDMPGVWFNGGLYETDRYEGTPTAGAPLTFSANSLLTADVQTDDPVIGTVVAVNGSTIKFKLLI